jgi:hypothetical protein
METPDLFARPYLTLVTAAELPNPPQGPIKAAVYAPGLICGAADDHRDAAATLTYGFLLPDAVRQSFFGSTCVTHWAPEAQPQPWQAALEQRHYVAGTEVPVNWRATTRRDYWRVVPLVSLIVSVEPRQKTRAMLRGYLKQMTTAHQRLT